MCLSAALLALGGCSDDPEGDTTLTDTDDDATADGTPDTDGAPDADAVAAGEGPGCGGSAQAPVFCPSAGQTCCGDACVDLDWNINHCGACGAACGDGEACVDGACVCGFASGQVTLVAEPGSTSGALETVTDPAIQAALRDAASALEVCADAVGPSGACCQSADGFACVDADLDAAHCGGCATDRGRACVPADASASTQAEQCQSGVCLCVSLDDSIAQCGPDASCCLDGCVNLFNDPANCGACGVACGDGEVCVEGVCSCGGIPKLIADDGDGQIEPDEVADPGSGPVCGVTEVCCGDPSASGARSVRCRDVNDPDEISVCSCGGESCTAGQTCCNQTCVDLTLDSDNCGACNQRCAQGFICTSDDASPTGAACACPGPQNACSTSPTPYPGAGQTFADVPGDHAVDCAPYPNLATTVAPELPAGVGRYAVVNLQIPTEVTDRDGDGIISGIEEARFNADVARLTAIDQSDGNPVPDGLFDVAGYAQQTGGHIPRCQCVNTVSNNLYCRYAADPVSGVDVDPDGDGYACGAPCPAGTLCAAGQCGVSCVATQTRCTREVGGAFVVYCVSPESDPYFCGAVPQGGCDSPDPTSPDYQGEACGPGQSCVNGACQ